MGYKRLTADGPRLKSLREAAWLNQDELGEMSGLTGHTIMRIEKGHTKHPTRPTLRKIARALKVHPDDLIKKDADGPLGRADMPRFDGFATVAA